MIKFDVKNRWTGDVQFTAEIDCDKSEASSIKLGLAVMWAIKTGANMRGANMEGAYMEGANMTGANMEDANMEGANMRGAYMTGANMEDANMRCVNMEGANMRGAYMTGANMEGANMRGVNMRGANIIHCGSRSDGYRFYAHIREGKIWILAGCRYFNITDAAKHWRDTRNGTLLGDESQQLLKNARSLVKIRGLK